MASLVEIQTLVEQIKSDLPLLINRSQIAPRQVVIVNGLSDVSERLGLIQAGEFRTGNGREPGFGFTGVRIGYPAFAYGGDTWNIAGINNDVIQFGVRATDGIALAGAGAVILNDKGIKIALNTAASALRAYGFTDAASVAVAALQGALTEGTSLTLQLVAASNVSIGHGDATLMLRSVAESGSTAVALLEAWVDGHVSTVPQIVVEQDSSGVGTVTINNADLIVNGNITSTSDGWMSAAETWTRTGTHTFTVSGDVTTTLSKGTKVSLVISSTTYYGVIKSSTHSAGTTTVTLLDNNDYSLASGTVTVPRYSYATRPEGFPASFAFTPSLGSLTVGNGTLTAKWWADGNHIKGDISFIFGSTSSMANVVFTTIVAALQETYTRPGTVTILDNGTALYYGPLVLTGSTNAEAKVWNASGTYLTETNISSTVPMTWASGDRLGITFDYLF